MTAEYYGYDETPITINKKLKDIAGFVNGGLYVPGGFAKLFPIKETRKVTPMPLQDFEMAEIKTALDKGFPVMIELDYNPKTVENDMHFVLVIGYNPADEDDFTIADPLGGKIRSLKDYRGTVFRKNARQIINQYVIFDGKVIQKPAPIVENSPFNFDVTKKMADKIWDMLNFDRVEKYVNRSTALDTIWEVIKDLGETLGKVEESTKNRYELDYRKKLDDAKGTLKYEYEQHLQDIKQNLQGDKEKAIVELQGIIDTQNKTIENLQEKIKELSTTPVNEEVIPVENLNMFKQVLEFLSGAKTYIASAALILCTLLWVAGIISHDQFLALSGVLAPLSVAFLRAGIKKIEKK